MFLLDGSFLQLVQLTNGISTTACRKAPRKSTSPGDCHELGEAAQGSIREYASRPGKVLCRAQYERAERHREAIATLQVSHVSFFYLEFLWRPTGYI